MHLHLMPFCVGDVYRLEDHLSCLSLCSVLLLMVVPLLLCVVVDGGSYEKQL